MQKIQAASDDASSAIAAAQTAMSAITNANGSFKWSILITGVNLDTGAQGSSGVQPQFLTDGIAAKLTEILNNVVDKVKLAKSKIAEARTQLAVALATVDPASPMYQQIQDMMAQIDSIETSYMTLIHKLSSQISLVTTYMNTLPGLANTVCPIPLVCGAAAYLLIEPIETAILNFQSQLMNV
jgi:hypothetical protein